jgi:hypothetical protein
MKNVEFMSQANVEAIAVPELPVLPELLQYELEPRGIDGTLVLSGTIGL